MECAGPTALWCFSAGFSGNLNPDQAQSGARSPHSKAKNLKDIESLLAWIDVLPFDDVAAFRFGQVRADLYARGLPIGPYDMMIAGHARSRGLILVTNNASEFARVPALRVENWVP